MSVRETLTAEEVQRAYDNEVQDIPKFSGRMSDLCKYIWAGSLGTLFALLTAAPATPAANFYAVNRSLVIAAAVAGSIAFVLDYLQNAVAYLHANRIVTWIERQTSIKRHEYNAKVNGELAPTGRALFVLKNLLALAAAALLGLAVVRFL
jgi:hypothetical protein